MTSRYQRIPDVLDAIQTRLNRDGSHPGTAVTTCSTRQDAIPRTLQALTGRLHTPTIWPLSHGEIAGESENLLEWLRNDPDATADQHSILDTSRSDYIARVCAGGMPLAARRGSLRPSATAAPHHNQSGWRLLSGAHERWPQGGPVCQYCLLLAGKLGRILEACAAARLKGGGRNG